MSDVTSPASGEAADDAVDSAAGDALYGLRPSKPTWTHIALRVKDIDATIGWYQRFTPLQLLDKRQDEFGFGAWLGEPESVERPFVLVLAQFLPETDPFKDAPQEILAPFAHLGVEMPNREDIDEAAKVAEEAGCLAFPPTQMPPPIGYICMLRDPDGNMVELSYDQGVYATAKQTWG